MNSASHDHSERGWARDRLVLKEHQLTTREFVNYFASVDTNWTVLDIGCGDGFYLEILRNLGFQQIYGMDESLARLAVAQKKGLRAFEGSVYELEADEQLNAIIMCDQLERLENPGLAITRVYQALKKEGILYLTVPVVERMPSRFWSKVMKIWSRYEPPERPGAHTTDSIRWLLTSHQFEVTAFVRTLAHIDEDTGDSDEWLSLIARKPVRERAGQSEPHIPPAPVMIDDDLSAEAEDDAPTVIEGPGKSQGIL